MTDMPKRGDWPAAPVIYQIYPRSFYDSTGSGEGDLNGITDKLGYVADLGVDAVWISPFFLSPMHDGGYDVQDHTAVNPRFGTLSDWERLVEKAHGLGLRVMIDQILNHTSHRHPWFAKSVAREAGYDDWYIWKDPKEDGTPPNNWLSQFGPPAWTWNHQREQYYFHQFLDCQPNLNLRNDEVQARLKEQMRVWRDRGVDGFRFDAITSYLWDEKFRDNPPSSPETRKMVTGPSYNPYSMQDHEHDMLPGDGTEYACKVRSWAGDDAWLLGEITSGNKSIELVNGLCEPGGLDAAYTVDLPEHGVAYDTFRRIVDGLKRPGTFGWWLSSHDQPRQATNHGDGSRRDARFLAMLIGTMPGPWQTYQGEELALPQPYLDYEEDDDPFDRLYWPDSPGRQGPRVPIPWAEGYKGFGFTARDPWLPMRWEGGRSVAAEQADGDGVLAFYKRLIAWRRESRIGEGRITDLSRDGEVMRVETDGPAGPHVGLYNLSYQEAALPDGLGDVLFVSEALDGAMPPRSAGVWAL